MEGIVDLHHDIMFFLVWIVIAVIWVMFEIVKSTSKLSIFSLMSIESKNSNLLLEGTTVSFLPSRIQHHTLLEIV
jgi:hypothetical protein